MVCPGSLSILVHERLYSGLDSRVRDWTPSRCAERDIFEAKSLCICYGSRGAEPGLRLREGGDGMSLSCRRVAPAPSDSRMCHFEARSCRKYSKSSLSEGVCRLFHPALCRAGLGSRLVCPAVWRKPVAHADARTGPGATVISSAGLASCDRRCGGKVCDDRNARAPRGKGNIWRRLPYGRARAIRWAPRMTEPGPTSAC